MAREELQRIPISQIDGPRISLRPVRRNAPEYAELVESIIKDGLLQPILVRPNGDRFEVVDGRQRYEASKEAGLEDIPCYVRDRTDDQVLVDQVKCNAIRPETRSFEYARRLKILMEKGYSVQELSALVDKTPAWISNQLQLNRLCEEARPAYERGEIKMTSALALANLPTDIQETFVDDAVVMKAGEFVERAKMAERDHKAYLLKVRQEDRESGAAPPKPRAINVMKREALEPKYAPKVLKAAGAQTPMDGWVACLQWVFKLDPISVENRKAGRKREESDAEVRANRQEWRKLNRDLIKKFVTPTPSGD